MTPTLRFFLTTPVVVSYKESEKLTTIERNHVSRPPHPPGPAHLDRRYVSARRWRRRHTSGGSGCLALAIWKRVQRFERRFCALYARWKAGTLPKARVRAVAHPSTPAHRVKPRRTRRSARKEGEQTLRRRSILWRAMRLRWSGRGLRPVSVLPRGFAWLYKMLPVSAGTLGGGLESLLLSIRRCRRSWPRCPQAGRLLRPICAMVGLKPPEWLALPKRKRVRKKGARAVRGGRGGAAADHGAVSGYAGGAVGETGVGGGCSKAGRSI